MSQFRAAATMANGKPINDIIVYHDPALCARLCQENSHDDCDYHVRAEGKTKGEGIAFVNLPMSQVNHYISATYNGERLDVRGVKEFGGSNYAVDLSFNA
jgi:hypothetical protein